MWFIIIGFVSGIVSGMGIGGGTVLIPALTLFFALDQQTAQNSNLIYFIPTAVTALLTHKKVGNIESGPVWKLILYGLIGAAAGSLVAVWMDSGALRKVFAVFLLAMGIYEFFKKDASEEKASQTRGER